MNFYLVKFEIHKGQARSYILPLGKRALFPEKGKKGIALGLGQRTHPHIFIMLRGALLQLRIVSITRLVRNHDSKLRLAEEEI